MFSETLFNTFLADIGARVTWRQASECPCRLPRSGGTQVDCPVCEGLRYVWDDGIQTTIGVQGIKADRKFAAFVEWEKGDMLATIPSDSPAYDVGEYDRFTMDEAEFRFSAVLTKGVNDRLKYAKIRRISRVWAIVDGEAQSYQEGVDFGVNGAAIAWVAEKGPPDGTQYTVRYFAAPEYFVYLSIPQDRIQSNLNLPKRVPLRLMDLFQQAVA